MRLSEARILTNSTDLRAMARVLTELADEMESLNFGHVHLADRLSGLGEDIELVIVKASQLVSEHLPPSQLGTWRLPRCSATPRR